VKAERKDEGETEFSPRDLPRRILSYEKIVKAERKDEGETEFSPRDLPRRSLFFLKDR